MLKVFKNADFVKRDHSTTSVVFAVTVDLPQMPAENWIEAASDDYYFDEYENLEHCLEDCFPIVSFEILETFIEILETLKDRNISPSLQDPTTLNEFFKDLKGFIKSHPIYNEMFWTFHCDEPCDYESSDDESSDIDKNA